jgi:demethylmacrocin O-methyltransferase
MTDAGIASLIRAADRVWPEPEELGDPTDAAVTVLREAAARAVLFGRPESEVTIQFSLGAPAGPRIGCVVALGPDGEQVQPGWSDDPPILISQDLVELLHGVYGRAGWVPDATRDVRILSEPGPETDASDDPWLVARQRLLHVANQMVEGCSPPDWDLRTLARRFGGDKWEQSYTTHYERYFRRLRQQRVRLLEIGVGGYESPDTGGESLRMWKYYFHRGLIYGLDIYDKSPLQESRIVTIKGDQADAHLLTELTERMGPIDIVIDDGSHLSAHVLTSFQILFPALRPGGIYVIEDLQTSYWPGWNGGHLGTSIDYLKSVVDELHHQDQLREGPYEPTIIAKTVAGIHFHHSIAFIEKGTNNAPTAPSWVRRYSNDMELTPKGSMRRATPSGGGS